MGLIVGKKMDSEIEDNAIYHELKEYTIRTVKAVRLQNKQHKCGLFHPMLDDLDINLELCSEKNQSEL